MILFIVLMLSDSLPSSQHHRFGYTMLQTIFWGISAWEESWFDLWLLFLWSFLFYNHLFEGLQRLLYTSLLFLQMKTAFVIPNTWSVLNNNNEIPGCQGEILFFLLPNQRAYSACKEHFRLTYPNCISDTWTSNVYSFSSKHLKKKTNNWEQTASAAIPKTEFHERTQVPCFMLMRADLKPCNGHLQQTWFPAAQGRSSCVSPSSSQPAPDYHQTKIKHCSGRQALPQLAGAVELGLGSSFELCPARGSHTGITLPSSPSLHQSHGMVMISECRLKSSIARPAFADGAVGNHGHKGDTGPTGHVLVRSMKEKGKKSIFSTPGTALPQKKSSQQAAFVFSSNAAHLLTRSI